MVPSKVAKLESDRKKEQNIKYIWFGCYAKNHKTDRNKNCKYHTCESREKIENEIDIAMRNLYPSFYGEFPILSPH